MRQITFGSRMNRSWVGGGQFGTLEYEEKLKQKQFPGRQRPASNRAEDPPLGLARRRAVLFQEGFLIKAKAQTGTKGKDFKRSDEMKRRNEH